MSTQPSTKLTAFKAYDIRGKMPAELNPVLAYWIGRGVARTTGAALGAKTCILGMDSRLSSPELLKAVAAGLAAEGIACQSLGLCGTEEVYFAAGAGYADMGVMVTASHNPMDYNGMKFVKKGGAPFDPVEDLGMIEEYVRAHMDGETPETFGDVAAVDLREAYVEHLMRFVGTGAIPAQKIVINAGNGAAGPTADAILKRLPQLEVIRLHHAPDGTFPNGIPNPLLVENRQSTIEAVKEHGASLGIAWDGDFDRCFLYDENGAFVSSYYMAGLLAESVLAHNKGANIVHDPRLYWDTKAAIEAAGGKAVVAKVGHSNIKPAMRAHDAPFAGEVSGHFYFRDFFYCDTGMLPWLLVLQYLGQKGQTLAEAVGERVKATPSSEEMNFVTPVAAKEFLAQVEGLLPQGGAVERVDGVSLSFADWRMNVRASNTEPLLRLNVEAREASVLEARLAEVMAVIETAGGHLAGH